MKKEFQMTQEQLDKLVEACQPVPYLVFGGKEPMSQQEMANIEWKKLADEIGFIWDSVEPVSKDDPTRFLAIPTELSIEEGNRLIAEFMGWKLITNDPICSDRWVNKSGEMVGHRDNKRLSFHTSWDWLMSVVEKIEQGNYGFKMCRKVVEVYYDSTKIEILRTKESSRLKSLWKAVILFIQWHNKNQANP